jgi:hypothetical protein
MARHILRDNAKAYDKGVLAEILVSALNVAYMWRSDDM